MSDGGRGTSGASGANSGNGGTGGNGGSGQGTGNGCGSDDAMSFTPQELTNLLYSFGRAAHPAPELFAAVAAPVTAAWLTHSRALVGWTAQDVANTLWACAAADERHEHLIAACETALCTRGFVLLPMHLTQIQQWLIWWEVELRCKAPLITPSLRAECQRALAAGDQRAGHTVSALQMAVERGLIRIGLQPTPEIATQEGYSIDLAILPEKVAIEVDGPTHYTQAHTPTGATLLKRRQLLATGWRVVNIPYFEWYAFERSAVQEDTYLRRLLVPWLPSGHHPSHRDSVQMPASAASASGWRQHAERFG